MLSGMSRPRSRPTRDETRDRLLRAAARVFADKGIGTASIEDICDEAGFSRGAFYSNFTAKDELVVEILATHMATSSAEVDRLYAASADPADFIENMESDRRERTGPLDFEGADGLYVELLLYALRNPDNRPLLVDYHRQQRMANVKLLEQIVESAGREYPMPLDQVSAFVMAVDMGVGLQKLIDPELNPPDQFTEFMVMVHRLWMATPPGAFD